MSQPVFPGPERLVVTHGPLPDLVISRMDASFGKTFPLAGPPPDPARVVCVATTGKATLSQADMRALPGLRRIACLGAGTEGVDVAAAAELGISVTSTAAVLAHDVADLAMGLVVGLFRNLLAADAFVRSGAWTAGRLPLGRTLQGAKLGVLGLGAIGAAVAARAVACGMEVGYHSRRRRADIAYRYLDSPLELARWSDALVVCCPGGTETRGLIGAEALRLLGPDGYLVNVARGTVVDEGALADALRTGRLAGAGLDVFEDEPRPHPNLVESERVILTPHIGSATSETREAMIRALIDSINQVVSI